MSLVADLRGKMQARGLLERLDLALADVVVPRESASTRPTKVLVDAAKLDLLLRRQQTAPTATVTVISDSGTGGGSDLTPGAIAGIVIGSIAGFLLLLWIVRSCTQGRTGAPPDRGGWIGDVGYRDTYASHGSRSRSRSRSRSYDPHHGRRHSHGSRHHHHHHGHGHRHSSRRGSAEIRPVVVETSQPQAAYVYQGRRGRSPRVV